MTQKANRKLRVVVCGTRFGQFYLEAVRALPEQYELVGLLAKGSERSRQCAERLGVPLFTEVGQLPANLDLACVVLRSTVMGGQGTNLALELLERGIHVLSEQPIHQKDLAACLKQARQSGVYFMTGDLYVHLPAVRRFIACAKELLAKQPALYIEAACATQVSYPLMHILQEALPTIRPWKINHVIKDEGPFQVLIGQLGKIPVTLLAHNEVDPDDPDNHLHLLHKITIGTAGGSLSLTDTHGPVVWQPRLHVPDLPDIHGTLVAAPPAHMLESSTEVLGTYETASYRDILTKQWPQAIGRDLLAMREMILGNVDRAAIDMRAQQELLCSRGWQDWTQALGYPVLRANGKHQPISLDVLRQAALQIPDDLPEPEESTVQGGEANRDVFTCSTVAESELAGVDAEVVKEGVERLEQAALASMLLALQSQGALAEPDRRYSSSDIFSLAQVAPRHEPVIWRWLHVLQDKNYIDAREDAFQCGQRMSREEVERRWMMAKEAWSGKLGSPLVIDYLKSNADQLPALMNDTQQAALLLFPEGRMDVANALYRDTLVAKYLNKSVAEAASRIASGKRSLRILEVGAGTGATTDGVVARLRPLVAKGLRVDYMYTDVSHFFLAAARQRFKDCPWMSFAVVDIDKNLFEQGVEPGSVDIVVAAGMLNNARDTDQIIRSLMESLVPGGWMLITEPTREFTEMLISQAFMMTPPVDDRKQTQSTFMTVQQWRDVFHGAGVGELAVLPGEDHPLALLGQKLFVIQKGQEAEKTERELVFTDNCNDMAKLTK
ncbi:bifunctional Gfo/Idh/MocA family oxidoreductase/class I SAM-dependent methyltransferase [Brevibacillus sp. 1238]|uniref:bifunctional Gfo/Idh/MocA family oxidoreductase/class I SAM-dependent methyltransferase n=1 Tax=Brevibacillus sp. 1238 TaxID=2940565 RepID=UPI0024742109|nr:bifunctional Gfo/Idh/MocA family oxidoreductase/class I SAM-dependent methyltransferase [Brevibacillus sp. 1238]MDH6351181.1 thiazolinyl imide reductase [Brevibacillus sp. 1238]